MQKEAMILRKSRESILKGLVEGKERKKCNYIIISFFKPVSIGKQPQAINIHKEEAAVTNLYTYSSIVYKHLSFHTPSAFTFGPKKALPSLWIFQVCEWWGELRYFHGFEASVHDMVVPISNKHSLRISSIVYIFTSGFLYPLPMFLTKKPVRKEVWHKDTVLVINTCIRGWTIYYAVDGGHRKAL